MARSTETFNKKEKEKKRLKKQKEKREKAEERKENVVKGKSLDEMMAYVDENGNITSTPPDPTKKKKIITEDILIATPKQEAIQPGDLIRKGKVTFFNESKGYGFIKDSESQESIFVHINELSEAVGENDKVTFEVEPGQKGMTAVRVKKV
ncbi:cold-shock protein [Daejeonella lutea]|uniref:Cold shock protein, CspA family n=1 Tax=Daejeonella lutea TaxID=572036 RepID=A0A1T5F850_9SPHI|nr:cold shock domain-containing protein [Daejeonella lutea]SKB92353.1 Cold shock protein, CspA family [Daejeonella lutea]